MSEKALPDSSEQPAAIDGGAVDLQQPEWNDSAKRHASQLTSDYGTTLRQVAESVTIFSQLQTVNLKHVEDAHSALARVGLSRFGWLSRPENETALGGALLGFSAAGNDIITVFCKDPSFRDGATWVWCVLFFVAGVVLYAHGWHRGRLPGPPGYKSWPEQLFDWMRIKPVFSIYRRTRIEFGLAIILFTGCVIWWRDHHHQAKHIEQLTKPTVADFLGAEPDRKVE